MKTCLMIIGMVANGKQMNPKYPIYIISKGRWESRLTSKALEKMNVPYRMIIEESEYKQYASVIGDKKLIVLPYDNPEKCSIPARNYVFEHSIAEGHKRHWIFDDNIQAFCRLNRNRKIRVTSGAMLRAAEDFVDRYENVGMSGLNYRFFAPEREKMDPYRLNTRIYSCILLDNSIPHRWRGKYNEDTDLSIRILKDGLCTILFNAFLCDKIGTLKMSGGNEQIYDESNDRKIFAESLQKQHPDIVEVVRRYGRFHHEVDYSGFEKNLLIKKSGLNIQEGINNYNMTLVEIPK